MAFRCLNPTGLQVLLKPVSQVRILPGAQFRHGFRATVLLLFSPLWSVVLWCPVVPAGWRWSVEPQRQGARRRRIAALSSVATPQVGRDVSCVSRCHATLERDFYLVGHPTLTAVTLQGYR
jgi:hypothetical protein